LKEALERAVARRGQFALIEVMLPRGATSRTLARFVSGFKAVRARSTRNKAIELAFLSEVVEAKKLEEWNVVNRVVDDANLETETATLVQRLASTPPQSYAATKSLSRVWQHQGRPAARAALYDISMPLFDTADVQSALHNACEPGRSNSADPKEPIKS
jgi:enoyl-CoA hydratase/carnithine racemase